MENDVVLDDATVSRNHATIAYQDGEYYIEDAGSMSGTMVEGIAATRTLLASGATLKMGEAELVFMQTEPEAAGAAVGATGTGGGATGTGAAGPGETVVMQPPQSGVMAWLAVTSGPSKGKTYQLREGENTIGRSSDNDLAIEDTSISRSHAMVRVQDDRFVLVDLGSRGGTKVGDRRLEGRTISTGGVVTVGQTRLNLVEVEGQEPLEPGTMSGQTIVDLPGGGSAVLIAQSGPDSGRSFPLAQGDNSIGRDPDSEVLLTDDAVSRRRALIRAEQDGFVVFDLGSRSGTLVDGEAMTGQELSGGDTISVGRTEVVLMQPGS
jgi:pSer/pThr/pTyr-binding forkhead associated (FHA) protein